ncbi:hypothetical protein KW783_04110, partial [Candidatus Parcubacteria bacterium]|nr:hypothetical protein [Candidatus Parcubacteria bacterium]
FFLLWLVSGGRWIGFGDAKLAAGIGWLLGLAYGLSALFLAFWIGAAFSIVYIAISRLFLGQKNLTMKSEIPFAPFLIAALFIVFLFHIDVVGLTRLFALHV